MASAPHDWGRCCFVGLDVGEIGASLMKMACDFAATLGLSDDVACECCSYGAE
jgi:hypothetical protein